MYRPTTHSILRFLLTALILLLSSCTPATTVPLEQLRYGTMDASNHTGLMVLLRGIGGSHEDFEQLGAIDAIRRRQLPFDIVAPNTHFGYYKERNLVDRLHEDIIVPARRQGYQQIWLAGFSMGGLGSLLYVREHPDQVDGVMLVSPFLGWDPIIHEIKQAGGVERWQQDDESESDWQRMLWSWLKRSHQQPERFPPIYLGYGRDDYVADEGPELLATLLDPQRSFTIKGGHTNRTMLRIFYRHLQRLSEQFDAPTTVSSTP